MILEKVHVLWVFALLLTAQLTLSYTLSLTSGGRLPSKPSGDAHSMDMSFVGLEYYAVRVVLVM